MTIHYRTLFGAALCASATLATAQVTATDPSGSGETPRARQLLEQVPDLAFSPDAVIVRFKSTSSEATKTALRASIGGQTLRKYSLVPGMELVSAPQGINRTIVALQADPNVLYAEPDYVVRPANIPNDPQFSSMWGLNTSSNFDINAPEAWDIFTGDPNFIIATIDTGVQYTHPDLAANIWTNPREIPYNGVDDDGNGYVDDVHGWNFADHNNDPTDVNGHGTHTAGTIGAVGNNGIGVTGINWRCKIMPLKFIGSGGGFESDGLAAIQYAFRNGARISNNSWGSNMFMQGVYDAISQARQAGHLFVAAAGNAGFNVEQLPFYPASFDLDNIISVTAIDSNGALTSYANYSATGVDIAAPGDIILSTTFGDGFRTMSGTSMACPHVAGVAALVWGRNPGMTFQQVRDRLFATARRQGNLAGKMVTGGSVDAAAALQGSYNSPPQVTITAPSTGYTFSTTNSVFFGAMANDPEEGDLSGRTVWSSDLQGYLGSGSGIWRNGLVAGTHRITASVTDSNGATTQASITVYVQQSASLPAAPQVSWITASANGYVQVGWIDNSDNESYFEIEREQRANRYWKNTTTAGTVGANVTSFGSTPGLGNYRFRVRAVNGSGASAWSNWISVKVG